MHARAACQNHVDREAIGICVRCRARICSECVTQIDGVNHCVACFGKAQAPLASTSGEASLGLSIALATLGSIMLVAALWALLEIAFPGG